MENSNELNIYSVSEKLKNELSLFDDEPYQGNSEGEELPWSESGSPQGSLPKKMPEFLSDEARYIAENFRAIGLDEFKYPLYQDDESEIMTSIVLSVPEEDRKKLNEYLGYSPLYFEPRLINDAFYYRKVKERNLTISTLIRHYKTKGKKVDARRRLQERFMHQSYTDQMKIMRLFLNGTKKDREWCYRTMLKWWDDSLTADLEKAWIDHHDEKCVKTAVIILPEAFVKEHQEAMGKVDYKNVCRRLAHDPSFVIDKSRLFPTDYCYVIAHSHRRIDDQEADQLLFGQIKHILSKGWIPMEFKTRYGHPVKDQQEEKLRYLPSMLFNGTVGYMVWALGQSGNASTLMKFHFWNKSLQNNMPQYLAQEKTPEEISALMSKDYREYQRWNWEVFAKHAYKSVVELVPDDNSEFKREKPSWTIPEEMLETRLIEVFPKAPEKNQSTPEKEAIFGPSLSDDCPF